MAEITGIGWCKRTQNFWWGCKKVSEECRFCYIDSIMRRGGREPFAGPIRTSEANWQKPYSWNRAAIAAGIRERVFTCSMSDFFHPGADAWRPEAWEVIRNCAQLDWLILTKRPELIADRLPSDWGDGYPNVWLGVTVGQASSLHRIDTLLQVPARLYWGSAEPLLGPIEFRPYLGARKIEWLITGCERAAKGDRRLMNLDWVRDIDRQCREAGVAHFFKQRYVEDRGNPVTDGLLDGEVRQEFPKSPAARLRRSA